MAQAAWQVVDGRIHYAGRTLAEWVPDLARAINAPAPVDLLVTDPAEIAERGDLPGILRVALREGRVVYEQAG
jgi:hypothetical protein